MPSDLATIPGDLAPMIIPIIHPGNCDVVRDDNDDDGYVICDDHGGDDHGSSATKLEDLVLGDTHITDPAGAGG